MKKKVLWIEDAANAELATLASPIYLHGDYDLTTVTDATMGLAHLTDEIPFDAVVVDIRLPPGPDPRFKVIFQDHQSNKIRAKLGLHLLEAVLGGTDAIIQIGRVPEWVKATIFAVFSVDSGLQMQISALGVEIYEVKKTGQPPQMLLAIIEKILHAPISGHLKE